MIPRKYYAYDWNVLLQEISTFAISGSLTIIYLSSRYEETKLALVSLSLIAAFGVSLKCLIYTNALNFNEYKRTKNRKEFRPNLDHYMQESATLFLGLIGGAFLAPVFQSMFVFENFSHPPLLSSAILAFLAVALKIALYTRTLDISRGRIEPKNLGSFAASLPWSLCVQAFATLFLGFLVGAYIYVSGILFLAAEEHPEHYPPEAFRESQVLIGPIFGGSHSLKEDYEYRTFGQLWDDEHVSGYLIVCVVLMFLALFVKARGLFGTRPMPSAPFRERRSGRESSQPKPSSRQPSRGNPAPARIASSPRVPLAEKKKKRTPMPTARGAKPADRKISGTREFKLPASGRRLDRTQEHRLPSRASISRTQEHRIDPDLRRNDRTVECKMPSQHQAASGWENLLTEASFFLTGTGAGLFAVPILRTAFFYKKAAYPPFAPALSILMLVLFATAAFLSFRRED